tara:strand:+ start:126 stop:236 length:111 start_codon:yes stop_codon:yes gene_type:complete
LPDAINDVDAREKNKPKANKRTIVKKIGLSMFFHHP